MQNCKMEKKGAEFEPQCNMFKEESFLNTHSFVNAVSLYQIQLSIENLLNTSLLIFFLSVLLGNVPQ